MLRRRPPRRPPLRRPLFPPMARPGRRPPLPAAVLGVLARANNLLAAGKSAEAAAIFEQLSKEAEQTGMPIRAADLALQASRARFAAGHVEHAMEWAKRGLRLFVQGGRAERVPRVLAKMTSALRDKGYTAQADDLEQVARHLLEEAGLPLEQAEQQAAAMPERRGSLPAKCASCGAPLLPDEVEWHDAHTAECLYCGTIVKTV